MTSLYVTRAGPGCNSRPLHQFNIPPTGWN